MPSETNWNWPDEMDALIAAPKHHRLLFENEQVRVLETVVAPGETVPVHTHRWPSVLHVVSMDDFVRRDETGRVLVDMRQTKTPPSPTPVLWTPPLPPHSLENVGQREIRCINVELKSPPTG